MREKLSHSHKVKLCKAFFGNLFSIKHIINSKQEIRKFFVECKKQSVVGEPSDENWPASALPKSLVEKVAENLHLVVDWPIRKKRFVYPMTQNQVMETPGGVGALLRIFDNDQLRILLDIAGDDSMRDSVLCEAVGG